MSSEPSSSSWILPAELASQLRVDERTIYRWIEAGLIPGAVRLPTRGVRLPADAAERLVRPIPEKVPA